MDDVHFEGDPEIDSTRRHMERALKSPQRPRWPWIAAALAGGAAFAWWKMRHRTHNSGDDAETTGSSPGQG